MKRRFLLSAAVFGPMWVQFSRAMLSSLTFAIRNTNISESKTKARAVCVIDRQQALASER